MAKQEIFGDYPIAGAIMRFVETFPVDQKGADREALERCSEILKRKEQLVIFPEGHCSKTGDLQPLEPGLAMLALKNRVRVVPIGTSGRDARASLRHADSLSPRSSACASTSASRLTFPIYRACRAVRPEPKPRAALKKACARRSRSREAERAQVLVPSTWDKCFWP
jgi:hypothetical protein